MLEGRSRTLTIWTLAEETGSFKCLPLKGTWGSCRVTWWLWALSSVSENVSSIPRYSQPTLALSPEDLMPSSSLCWYLHTYGKGAHRHTHIHENENKSLKQNKGGMGIPATFCLLCSCHEISVFSAPMFCSPQVQSAVNNWPRTFFKTWGKIKLSSL